MLKPPCDYCTGSHWLMDNPGLGQCACCTPDAMARIEADNANLQQLDEPKVVDWNDALATLAEVKDHLHKWMVRNGMDPNAVVLPDEDLDIVMDCLAPWE